MKKCFLLTLLLFGATFSTAQIIPAAQMPRHVLDSLKTRFPNANNIVWNRNDAGYKASFVRGDGRKAEAFYDQSARWTQTNIACDSICPLKIQNHLVGYNQKSTTQINRRNGTTTYLVVAEKAGREVVMEFDKSGNLISTK
jgi:hypothetical protein